jgi:hypothetical protein
MIWTIQFQAVKGEEIMAIATTPSFHTRECDSEDMRLAEDGWNTLDSAKVAFAYAIDSRWRNRSEFINGRKEIICFPLSQVGKNSTRDSSRKCGHSRESALLPKNDPKDKYPENQRNGV